MTSILSFFRGLPLFVSGRPGTPLRVLCLMAFDTVCVLRNARRLPSQTLQTLAALLDFGACMNDFFDGKDFSRQEYRSTRRLLASARKSLDVSEYISRLRDMEIHRPSPGGDERRHRMAQSYRESVIRLSLAANAATALDDSTIEEGIEATHRDEDFETLFRIVMLCQIIDDVLDYQTDSDGGLPSFLTAHASPYRALAMSSDAAAQYADRGCLPASPHVFPFRVVLLSISALAGVAILFGRWRLKAHALRKWLSVLAGRFAEAFCGRENRK